MGQWLAEFEPSATEPVDGQWITYRIDYDAPHIPWTHSSLHIASQVCDQGRCYAQFEFPDEWGCVEARIWTQLSFPCTESGCEPTLKSNTPSASLVIGECPNPPIEPIDLPEPDVGFSVFVGVMLLVAWAVRKF